MFILIFFSFFTIIISTTQVCYFQDEREINNKIFKIIYKKAPDESIDRYINNTKVSDADYFDSLITETLNEEEEKINSFNKKCAKFDKEQQRIQHQSATKIFKILINTINKHLHILSMPHLKNFIDFDSDILTKEDYKESAFLISQINIILKNDPDLKASSTQDIIKTFDYLEKLTDNLESIIQSAKKRAIELSDDTKQLKELLEV